MLDDALGAIRGARHMIGQLVSSTRRSAADEGERETIRVSDVLNEVASLCRHSYGRRLSITASVAPNAATATIRARPGDLHQVLLNLCVNAKDAMEDCDDAHLSLSLARETGPNRDDVVVSVRDNGHGISEEALEHMGEPFYTTKPPGEGTGLGLASAYATVGALGGGIRCRSKVQEGTTFELRIPCAVRTASRATPTPSTFDGERALVIDDDPLVRRALCRQLRSLGLHVTGVASGEEALQQLAAREDIGVVFMEQSLRAGPAFVKRIRGQHEYLPIILVGADHIELADASEFLRRPVAYDELRRALVERLAS